MTRPAYADGSAAEPTADGSKIIPVEFDSSDMVLFADGLLDARADYVTLDQVGAAIQACLQRAAPAADVTAGDRQRRRRARLRQGKIPLRIEVDEVALTEWALATYGSPDMRAAVEKLVDAAIADGHGVTTRWE